MLFGNILFVILEDIRFEFKLSVLRLGILCFLIEIFLMRLFCRKRVDSCCRFLNVFFKM